MSISIEVSSEKCFSLRIMSVVSGFILNRSNFSRERVCVVQLWMIKIVRKKFGFFPAARMTVATQILLLTQQLSNR